jgi:hypothetical protein
MNSLTCELKVWLEVEKASPGVWVENDPKLLEIVLRQLSGMRILLAKEDNDALMTEYREMYNAYTELLEYRVIKNANIVGI